MGYAVPLGCEQGFPAMSQVLLALQSQGPLPVPPMGSPDCFTPSVLQQSQHFLRAALQFQMGDLPLPQLCQGEPGRETPPPPGAGKGWGCPCPCCTRSWPRTSDLWGLCSVEGGGLGLGRERE